MIREQLHKIIDENIIHMLHDKDMDKVLDSLVEFVELKCKETARNVRHRADTIYAHLTDKPDESIRKEIMNIQFKDIKPEGL